MTEEKKYEKPDLNELGNNRGELSEKDLNRVTGGSDNEAPALCQNGSVAGECGAGTQANVRIPG